jgi:hypothetical protein
LCTPFAVRGICVSTRHSKTVQTRVVGCCTRPARHDV